MNTQNRTSPCLQVQGSIGIISKTFVSRCSSRIDDQQLRVAAQAIQQTLAEAAICSPTDAEAAWEGNTAEKKRMRRDSVSGNKGITWYNIRNKHQNVVIVLRDHNHCKTEMMDWQTGKIWQIYDHLRTVISSMRKDFRFTRLARPNSRKAPKQVSL